MTLTDLIPGVSQAKLIIGSLVITAVVGFVGWSWWTHNQIEKSRAENAVLKQNVEILNSSVKTLQDNYLKCQRANTTNADTIAALQKERDDAKAAVSRLASQRQRDAQRIGSLQDQINRMKKDPANNGPLAPVLRETIRGIQHGEK